ncbi:proton myo-inositol cotransporter-like [Tachypleus tridentatus]|uniref:proton myo-inositol cotransporter-like n=1 Tax=Tachypleus tridentatus TaxID=6853 RepID=UPI003FD4FD31
MSSEFINDVEGLLQDRVKPKAQMFMYTVTLLSAVGGFMSGYDTGAISGAMMFLRKYFELDYTWQKLVIGVTMATAWTFSLIAGYFADRLGRKPVIILSSFVFTVGAVLMGTAVDKGMFLGGRFVIGVALGLTSTTVPVYISEVSPPEFRGRLVTLNYCFLTGGQFVAGIIDGAFSNDETNGWRFMLGLAALPSFIQFFGFLMMPESPRWLMAQGKYQEALEVLKSVHGQTSHAKEEFDSIKANYVETEREMENTGSGPIILQVFRNPAVKRALTIGCLLHLTHHFVGSNTVTFYGASVIEMCGIRQSSSIVWLTAVIAVVNLCCSFPGLVLVEKIGRRPLTLFSLAGVSFSLGIMAVGFQLANVHSPQIQINDTSGSDTVCSSYSSCSQCVNNPYCGYCFLDLPSGPSNGSCLLTDLDKPDVSVTGQCNSSLLENPLIWSYHWCPSDYSWLILVGLILYLLCFSPGMGSMPWTVNSEIYPFWARSTSCATTTSVNWLSNIVVFMLFPSVAEILNKYGIFWLYMSVAVLAWIYFFLMLPETRGKRLEEVESLFAHPWWQDATTADEKKTVQYVHIRGINQATNVDDPDSGEES